MVCPLLMNAAVYHPNLLWKNGQIIKVGFQNNVPEAYKQKIEEVASIYEQYANIDLEFTDDNMVHIVIGEESYSNPYSYVGALSLRNKRGDKTMNLPLVSRFKNIKSFDDDDYYFRSFKRIILHEFGHALGLQHEHQNPNANICWDVDAMNDYCNTNEISCSNYLELDNKLSVVDLKYLKYSVYDRNSIMHYQIDNEPTFCDYKSPYTYNLSSLDKRWINIMYPFDGEVQPNKEMIVHIESVSIEALHLEDEFIFGRKLQIYGEIGFTSRRDIGEDCYSDLSNCYEEAHNSNIALAEIDKEEPITFGRKTPHYRITNFGSLNFGINDEYFLHITLLEKDLLTADDTFTYTANSQQHIGDILVPIENLFWQKSWVCKYDLSEKSSDEPQLRLTLKLQLAQ